MEQKMPKKSRKQAKRKKNQYLKYNITIFLNEITFFFVEVVQKPKREKKNRYLKIFQNKFKNTMARKKLWIKKKYPKT